MTKREQAGFSLVELMVSMVLGLMLIAGAVSIYLATKQSYREVEQVASLTENARFAEQILGDSLRHIGFFGEVSAGVVTLDSSLEGVSVTEDCNNPPDAGAYDLGRFGYAATVVGSGGPNDTGAALGCITDAYVSAMVSVEDKLSDVLVLKHVLPHRYTDSDSDGFIDGLQDDRAYVMTNVVSGLLFKGSDQPTIGAGGEVPYGTAWEYQYEVFYVRRVGGVPQLSRRVLSSYDELSPPEEVVEGVERLFLMFGYDSNDDGEVDTYADVASVNAAGNWPGVGSVEVFMLVRSATEDVQYTDNKTYQLGGVQVGPFNDHYRRLISHTSLSLRNLKLILRRDA